MLCFISVHSGALLQYDVLNLHSLSHEVFPTLTKSADDQAWQRLSEKSFVLLKYEKRMKK